MRGGGVFEAKEIGITKTGTAKFMKFPIEVGQDGQVKLLEYPIEYTIKEIMDNNTVARIKISQIGDSEIDEKDPKSCPDIYIRQPIPPSENYGIDITKMSKRTVTTGKREKYMLSEITSLNTPPPTASE